MVTRKLLEKAMPLAEPLSSVSDVAERFAVSPHAVLSWIASGELRAINVSRKGKSKRPTWRISATAIAEFELSRSAEVVHPKQSKPRSRKTEVIQFY
jgi:hypothetical protein